MALPFALRHPLKALRIARLLDAIQDTEERRITYEAVGIATPEWLAHSYTLVNDMLDEIEQLQGVKS